MWHQPNSLAERQALYLLVGAGASQQDIASKTRRTGNRAASLLRLVASSVGRTDTALGAFYRRLSARLGKAKAITATARKIAVLFYNTLRHGMSYVDPGATYYEDRYRQRVLSNLQRRARSLGFILHKVEPDTAQAAAIGNGETFARGRDLAAWLGLVPRQVTTGGKPRLVGITKRGNKYLRKLLIHGARSVLPILAASATPLGSWLQGLLKRTHKNAAVVALANKLARIVWVVLRRGAVFAAAASSVAA